MKKVIGILCVATLPIACSAYSTNDAEHSTDLGYYQNMSALAFVYGAELVKRGTNSEEQLAMAKEVSYVMFTYWANTRIGKLEPSRTVDIAIQKTYRAHFTNSYFSVADIFTDPVGWLKSTEPLKSLPEDLQSIDSVTYKSLLSRYHEFLLGVSDGNHGTP